MNILSIDFDYFFPNPYDYDWGFSENYSANLQTIIWKFRELSTKMYKSSNQSVAVNEFIADVMLIDRFFDDIKINDDCYFIITDSHSEIIRFTKHQTGVVIYNFDAHNDYYTSRELNCGNWVLHALKSGILNSIDDYHIVYPVWRRNQHDMRLWKLNQNNIHYADELPVMPEFDRIFIFQSKAFTPPWSANAFELLCRRTEEKVNEKKNWMYKIVDAE